MNKVLTERNFNLININSGFDHLAEIKKALENKEIIALHGDRYIDGNTTIKINFLGEEAYFPISPWNLASYFNVPVSYVFVVKEGKRKYRLFATPLKNIPFVKNPLKRKTLLSDSIKEYVTELQQTVNRYPLQWYNYYDFWK